MTATPVTIARQVSARKDAARARYEAGQRRDAARHGYLGPLTRAEVAEITTRAALTELAQ